MNSFYRAWSLLEAAPPPTPPPGGPPGGPPAGPPPGGGDLGGGMPGGPDMGAGGGDMGQGPPPATPVPVTAIRAADVWAVLRQLATEARYDQFFDKISVARRNPQPRRPPERKSSLLS